NGPLEQVRHRGNVFRGQRVGRSPGLAAVSRQTRTRGGWREERSTARLAEGRQSPSDILGRLKPVLRRSRHHSTDDIAYRRRFRPQGLHWFGRARLVLQDL